MGFTAYKTFVYGDPLRASELNEQLRDNGNDLIKGALEYTIDGGGTVPALATLYWLEVPYKCTLTAVRLFADQSGSIVIDVWKDSYANYPPTVGDTITAAAKPTIAATNKSVDTTLTGWTTALAEGDVLYFKVDSVTSITKCLISLRTIRS